MCSRKSQPKKNVAVKASVIVAEEIARASKTFSEGCMYVCLQQTALWCFVIPLTYFCKTYNNGYTGNKHTGHLMLFWTEIWLELHCNNSNALAWALPYVCMYVTFYEFSTEENGSHERSQPNIMQAFAAVNIPLTPLSPNISEWRNDLWWKCYRSCGERNDAVMILKMESLRRNTGYKHRALRNAGWLQLKLVSDPRDGSIPIHRQQIVWKALINGEDTTRYGHAVSSSASTRP